MKLECTYIAQSGLTVSLAVQASTSLFAPLSEDSEEPCAASSLASSSFLQAIPELSALLVQAHCQAALILQASCVKNLQDEVASNIGLPVSKVFPDKEAA